MEGPTPSGSVAGPRGAASRRSSVSVPRDADAVGPTLEGPGVRDTGERAFATATRAAGALKSLFSDSGALADGPGGSRAPGAAPRAASPPLSNAGREALVARIALAPTALSRFPDLFRFIAPERHALLLGDYARSGGREERFRDVGLSGARADLLWSRSCEAVSGECNRLAAESFYRKGEFVPPIDLDRMSKAKTDEAAATTDGGLVVSEYTQEEEREAMADWPAPPSAADRPRLRLGSLADILGRLAAAFGASSAAVEADGDEEAKLASAFEWPGTAARAAGVASPGGALKPRRPSAEVSRPGQGAEGRRLSSAPRLGLLALVGFVLIGIGVRGARRGS